MTKEELSDGIESLGSALANISLIVMTSQAAWPVPGFVLPHGFIMFAFITSLVATALRSTSKHLASFIFLFLKTKEVAVKTEQKVETKP